MKKRLRDLSVRAGLCALVVSIVVGADSGVRADELDGCSLNGIALHGDVEIVDSFPDFTVQIVDSFPDLKVEWVDSFPDSCGQWREVDSFAEFKIQYVDSFPDLKIQIVESFPGLP